MNISKITLVIPNPAWGSDTARMFNMVPYSICTIAAILKKDYDVAIIDANQKKLTLDEALIEIVQSECDVIGISCMSIEYAKSTHILAQVIKAYDDIVVIVGGAYPTVLPEFAMKDENIDYLVLSEGEYRLPALLKEMENDSQIILIDGIAYRNGEKVVINPVTQYITDLDALPLPAYDLVDYNAYFNGSNKFSAANTPRVHPYAIMVTSRGCPFECIFCSTKMIQGKECRMRSAENVLTEIDWLVSKYGIKEIIFVDDNMLLKRKRTETILNGLIERNYDLRWKSTNVPIFCLDYELLALMKKSGCYQLTLPIESANERILNILKKPLSANKAIEVVEMAKGLGIETISLYIIGTPGETWEEIMNTVEFADALDTDVVTFNIATPLPNTELYELAKGMNCLPDGFSFSDFKYFGWGHGRITTDEFTPEDLQMIRTFIWDKINFRTPEKREKNRIMNDVTEPEQRQWRTSTRRSSGVCVKYN